MADEVYKTREVPLKDSKNLRIERKRVAKEIFESMNSLLPSTYEDEAASSNYNQHLRALAEEFARSHQLLDLLRNNLNLRTASKEYLWQNFGYALDFKPSDNITAEDYRRLLIALVFVIVNGARVPTYQQALEEFTPYEVKIFEVFDLLDRQLQEMGDSVLNVYGGLLNDEVGPYNSPLLLNSPSLLNDSFMFDRRRSLWVVDILIEDAPNPIFPDVDGKLTEILEKTKSKETCVMLRNVLLDTFTIGDFVADGDVTILIGTIQQVSGAGLNIPENTLTAPNPLPFVLNLSPEEEFIADATYTIS